MTKSAADVEQEVMASRGQLDKTVEALRDKMTPGQLFDEASHAMGGMGQQMLSKLMQQAKENPMPLLVMGAGLAWLMTSSPAPSGSGDSTPRFAATGGASGDARANGMGAKVHELGDKAADMLSGVKDKLGDAVSSAGDAGQTAARTVKDAAGSVADKASDYGRRAQTGAAELLQREPLLIAALGVVVGAAMGVALPSTSAEDHMVGPMRDKIVDKGMELAHDSLEQVGDAAHAAYDAVKSELETPGGTDDLSHKVGDAARAGVQAASGAMQGHDGAGGSTI